MRRQKVNKEKKIVGVVYKYTSPSGKVYIGQTTNEAHRRRTWFCMKRRYAGSAINAARKKYGPENFEYEVLYKESFSSFGDALKALDEKEILYIQKYDSLKNGYNNTPGGLFPEYGIQTQLNGRAINEERNLDTLSHRRRLRPHHTKEEIQQLSKETNRKSGRFHKIYQFDLDGNYIREFSSAGEASEDGFGHYSNIIRACKTLGAYKGYNWRFAEDGKVMRVKQPKIKKPKKVYVPKGRPYKSVSKYSKDGNYICSYKSIKEAIADNGIKYHSQISRCLKGERPSAGGYVWKYNNI